MKVLDAFKDLKRDPRYGIFVRQTVPTGSRKFTCARYYLFHLWYKSVHPECRHVYELIPEDTPCRLYLDIEFYIQFNPGVEGTSAVKILLQLVNKLLENELGVLSSLDNIFLLDSTSNTKFSQHAIFDAVFANNKQVGCFVSKVRYLVTECVTNDSGNVCGFTPAQLSSLLINKSDGKKQFITDLHVYSRNQQFRMWESSKISNSIPLLLADESRVQLDESFDSFRRTLVVASHETDREIITFLPSENTASLNTSTVKHQTLTHSSFPKVDEYVTKFIKSQQMKHCSLEIKEYKEQSRIIYVVIGSRYCLLQGREHQSNRVFYVVDISRQEIYFKCHSCGKREESSSSIPSNLFSD